MQQEPGTEAPPARKRDRWATFRGLTWWQLLLSLLPLALVGVGGAIGGAIGAGGMVVNLWLAKRIGGAIKALAMIGVVLAAYLVYLVIGGIIYALTHPA